MNDELMKEIMRSEHLLCKGLKELNDSGIMTQQTLDMIYKISDIVLDYSKIYKEQDDGYGRRYMGDYDYRRR